MTAFGRAIAAERAKSQAQFVWEVGRLIALLDDELNRPALSIGLRLQIEQIEVLLGRRGRQPLSWPETAAGVEGGTK